MRIRSIKPEFWRSRHVAQLPWELRLLFVGLWSYVDDNGVGIDDPWQITADVFPVEPDPVAARGRVEEGLATLSRVVHEPSNMPFIVRYEVNGRRYLYITGWSHQRIDRPSKPRYPLPSPDAVTSTNAEPAPDPRESVASPPANCAPVTGEQGNRGTKRSSRTSRSGRYTDEFEQWWQLYPKRDGSKGSKFKAAAAFEAALKVTTFETLMAALRHYLTTKRVLDGYAKDGVTWLNQRMWEDAAPDTSSVDPTTWIRGEWDAGRVKVIEERTGLRYRQPDLPNHISERDDIERWLRDQARQWIADNRAEIVERLTQRTSA